MTKKTFVCYHCKKQETSPLRRGWDTFTPRPCCPECLDELLDAAAAALKKYVATPQGQARIERELANCQ